MSKLSAAVMILACTLPGPDAFCASLAVPPLASAQPADHSGLKAVLVTGTSTGIGRKISERLAADGYFAYATARKEEDLEALAAIKNVQPLHLDVTQPADIAAAVESITKAGRGLYGLVNNAGVATFGTIAEMSPEEFDLVVKVNAYGPVWMIKAFDEDARAVEQALLEPSPKRRYRVVPVQEQQSGSSTSRSSSSCS